jgi:hypothetical protein
VDDHEPSRVGPASVEVQTSVDKAAREIEGRCMALGSMVGINSG